MSEIFPKRGDGNTTLTISLSRDLRGRIEAAAAEDRRKVSPWIAIQMEKVLDELDGKENMPAKEEVPMLKMADKAREYGVGNGTTGK